MTRNLLLSCLCLFVSFRLAAQSSVVEVYRIFQAKCVSCHDRVSPEAGLDLQGVAATEALRAVEVAAKLVNVAPTNGYSKAAGFKRIYPGRPDRSFLFRKINNNFEPSIHALDFDEGSPMPAYPAPGGVLTDLEKEIIRQWILYGAASSGQLFDKSVLEEFYSGNGEKSFPDGPPPAPAPSEGFQIKMGPFYLAADGEVEYYQKYELNLPQNVEVNRLEIIISPYSHHLLVYDFDTPADASGIPHGLRLNSYHNNIGLVAAVQEETDLQLPEGTAFRWDKNLVLDLNSHYINYLLTRPFQCEAYLNIYTQPVGTAQQEMNAALLVNPLIPIPNNGNTITHSRAEFQPGADSLYIWGLMGHTHRYGTGYKVWKRLPGGQKGEMVYDASCPQGIPGCPAPYYDYQHIPLRYWEPQLLPIKWSNGIIHEATWVNDGPAPVSFGPTSDDEMMVLIVFYTEQPVTVNSREPDDPGGRRNLTLYPNPSADRVWVRLPGEQGARLVRVFNTAGIEVMRKTDVTGSLLELDVQNLLPGLYRIDADGNQAVLVRQRP